MSASHLHEPHLIHSLFKEIKKMNWKDIFIISLILISIGSFAYNNINSQFDKINVQFDKINSKLEKIDRDNRDFHGRLSYLEGKIDK